MQVYREHHLHAASLPTPVKPPTQAACRTLAAQRHVQHMQEDLENREAKAQQARRQHEGVQRASSACCDHQTSEATNTGRVQDVGSTAARAAHAGGPGEQGGQSAASQAAT